MQIRGLFGDGSIGATTIEIGIPIITSDKDFADTMELLASYMGAAENTIRRLK